MTVTYDTSPYFMPFENYFAGFRPDSTSTIAETFTAPAGQSVRLTDFTFYTEGYFSTDAQELHLRPIVYAWSGNLIGTGGGAVGDRIPFMSGRVLWFILRLCGRK